ncbi:hypothetical protein P280DRAFT_553338 [Massarina eburnea CBS 473.64]|uniref:Uncharacterized protein n=1 Tax=Massarina eburnea CBS 473.64 TaxID=1395130 RepID=A0A6A6RN64_9PLEO|nr:hypothetical protein P280DRAFT_553338 [Massarina eburnea CBS 473.64]
MSRTVELGRAVVSSTVTYQELWLTTLITLSPKQRSINLQHFSTTSLIDFLSSGDVWVERGNGMHLALEITSQSEPLDNEELQSLSEGITNAPAWKQLNLFPSLSSNPLPNSAGVRIDIAQLRGDVDTNTKKKHRICANVPSADAKPPEGMPILSLQSVQFAFVFSETRARSTPVRQKQRKQQTAAISSQSQGTASVQHQNIGVPYVLPDEGAAIFDVSEDEFLFASCEHPLAAQNLKRKRPLTVPSRRSPSTPLIPTATNYQNKRTRPHTISAIPVVLAETPDAPGSPRTKDLVDAAIRLSVLGNLRKSTGRLKVKANTFTGGLADIAPALWRPGYLAAVTQRAHLIPTLSMSLGKLNSRAVSIALQAKIGEVVNSLHHRGVHPLCTDSASKFDISIITSAVATRLWVLTQKDLLSKPVSGLTQSFCVSAVQDSAFVGADDLILEASEGFHDNLASFSATHTAQVFGEQGYAAFQADDDEILDFGTVGSTVRVSTHGCTPSLYTQRPGPGDKDSHDYNDEVSGDHEDAGFTSKGGNGAEEYEEDLFTVTNFDDENTGLHRETMVGSPAANQATAQNS